MKQQPVDMVCPHCKSDDVTRDSISRWDRIGQRWDHASELDTLQCEACGKEVDAFDTAPIPPVERAFELRTGIAALEAELSRYREELASIAAEFPEAPAEDGLERLIAAVPTSCRVSVSGSPKMSDRREIIEAVRRGAARADLFIYFGLSRVGWLRLIRDRDGYAIIVHQAAPDDVDGVIRRMVAACPDMVRPEVPA